jgi:2-polyprenyl-3-methyl-5-hydroxy-6-metoxy-1,4-benzoquinol methylase
MLSDVLSEDFYKWFRKFSAPLPEDINRYVDPGKRFIDIGAGNGFFLSTVTGTKQRAAVEVWDKQLAYLREHFPDVTLYASIFAVDGTYDVVACMDVLHHIENDAERDRFLLRLFELVTPGGTLVLKDMRDDLVVHKYFNRLSDYVSTGSHAHEMNAEALLGRLRAAGFEIRLFKKYTALLYGHYYIAAYKPA